MQAAIREAYEETGLSVEVGALGSVNECKLTQYGEHALFFTFRARLMNGGPQVIRPQEIRAVQWMDFKAANQHLAYHPGGIRFLLQASCPYVDEGMK